MLPVGKGRVSLSAQIGLAVKDGWMDGWRQSSGKKKTNVPKYWEYKLTPTTAVSVDSIGHLIKQV